MDNPVRLHWLDPRDPQQAFPDPRLAMHDPNGLLAIGGDLSPTRLLRAYAQGIFPWFNPDEPILWWSPDPRAVLRPHQFHTSRSLDKRLRRQDFALTLNHAFRDVLEACAAPRARSRGTWLSTEMKQAYFDLHILGHAQSIEVWRHGQLVGGVYGVALGRVFFGESMFSRIEDGSKIALHYLCKQLTAWDYDLLDCQVSSLHLMTLGAMEMPREEFLRHLRHAVGVGGKSGRWAFDIDVPTDALHLP
ncbi:MAG: leucyl/phenylalanyl-tRNA--protein transferase [Pseudomonadota bacterium]